MDGTILKSTPRKLKNSVAAMGIEAFLNEHYTRYAAPGKTPYQTFGETANGTDNDSELGRRFGRTHVWAKRMRVLYEQSK